MGKLFLLYFHTVIFIVRLIDSDTEKDQFEICADYIASVLSLCF